MSAMVVIANLIVIGMMFGTIWVFEKMGWSHGTD